MSEWAQVRTRIGTPLSSNFALHFRPLTDWLVQARSLNLSIPTRLSGGLVWAGNCCYRAPSARLLGGVAVINFLLCMRSALLFDVLPHSLSVKIEREMASLRLAAINACSLTGGLACNSVVSHNLNAARNLVSATLPPSWSRSSKADLIISHVSVRARAPEFSRRFIRVQVNPRSNELATIRSVPVQVARELLNAGHRYLDVRTAEEFAAGHVEGAVNVPYLKSAGGGMTKNLHFVEEVARVFDRDVELVVGCLSGRRSLMAAAELQAAEFSGVTDMMGGHKAWVDCGLPTVVRA